MITAIADQGVLLWLLAFAVLFGAALVQGVAGFAFGILSMAYLTLVWDPKTANVVVSLLTVWASLYTLHSVRHGMKWRYVTPLALGLAVGLPLGTWVLVMPHSTQSIRALVAVACVLVAYQNWRPRDLAAVEQPAPVWLGSAAGLLAGFLSGSVSAGGPPILWYVYRQNWTRDELKATALVAFASTTLAKLVIWFSHDLMSGPAEHLFTRPRLWLTLTMLPAVMLGSRVGVGLFQRVDREQLRRIVCALLVVMAASIVATLWG